MSCSPWVKLTGSALTFMAAVAIILPLRKPRAARLSRSRFTMQCSFLLMLVGARSYGFTREVCDHGCEPSPCEALAANIESFLLTGILPKMNVSALPRRGREQPSCGCPRIRRKAKLASPLADLRPSQTVTRHHE